jgi:uncharacterized protein YacL (UPF0231 family)
MKLKFYRDTAGDARAQGRGRGKVLAGFLESDLQDSPAAAREVLRAIEDVEAGRLDTWERTGNAHTLTLSPEGATLQNEIDEDSEPCRLSLLEIRAAVADWISFLEEPPPGHQCPG